MEDKNYDSWIFLDEQTRPDSRNSDLGEWSDSCTKDFQNLPIRRTPEGLIAAMGMGLETFDSIAQAERSLNLTMQLEGVDSEFVRKSTETIEAIQNRKNLLNSPCSSRSVSSFFMEEESEEGEESEEEETVTASANAAVAARDLKYGGRAPPMLGAIAPKAVSIMSSSIKTENVLSTKAQYIQQRNQHDYQETPLVLKASSSPDKDVEIESTGNQELSYPFFKQECSKNDKGERRRRRRESKAKEGQQTNDHQTSETKKNRLSWLSVWFGDYFFAPLVISHFCTLFVGIYLGRMNFLPEKIAFE